MKKCISIMLVFASGVTGLLCAKGNPLPFPASGFNRLFNTPLDSDSVWTNLNEMQAYGSNNPTTAYPGQIVSLVGIAGTEVYVFDSNLIPVLVSDGGQIDPENVTAVYVVPFSTNITIDATNGPVQYLSVTNNTTLGFAPSSTNKDDVITLRLDYSSGELTRLTNTVNYGGITLVTNALNSLIFESAYSRTNWTAHLLGTSP